MSELDLGSITASDIASLSNELVDRLVAWGSTGTITAQINEYLQAGADQVVLTVLDNGRYSAIDSARQLASRLPI